MGTVAIVSGLAGSVTAGFILDWTHKFKETSAGICVASLLSYLCFTGLLLENTMWVQFITIGLVGFFLTSYLVVGFEYGIEMTYPEPEIVSASLLNVSSMIFGIILVELLSFIMTRISVFASNGAVCFILFCCSILSVFMTTDYKRSKKNVLKAINEI
ncbi:uncharacterized MFS-type transporter C09D4.1-like isoform X1 [Stegodyphus dumicola]|uniref:uncharacterized MFS-type transporter C09D4.1-like isoform X1 n=1 Tax=Stegodyphus dumicola TaxID=202533 RepID=UPI0015B0F8FB|nr:uncharacterized MFS-type transporter C09D4.1-like isoform X1 [Stegodyphus dumicola]